MKLLVLAAVLTLPLLSQEIRGHYRSSEVDAYVQSSQNKQPDIPGLGETRNLISVSISSTDIAVAAFWVYVVVRLEDGSQITRQTIASLYGSTRRIATAQWELPGRPAEILKFHIGQLRESTELLLEIR